MASHLLRLISSPARTTLRRLDTIQGSLFRTQAKRSFHLCRPLWGVVSFKLADIGEGIAEVELIKWHKEVGQTVEELDTVCTVQSDKASVDITSRYTGPIVKFHHQVGDIVKVGDRLMDVEVQGEEDSPFVPAAAVSSSDPSSGYSSAKRNAADPPPQSSSGSSTNDVFASPATRRIAKELNVNLSEVRGTGKDGRITKEDVENYSKSGGASGSQNTEVKEQKSSTFTSSFVSPSSHEEKEVVIRGYGRAMVKSMLEASKVPHLNIGEEIDITDLLQMRERMKKVADKTEGLKLTITPLIIKSLSLSLLKFPILNSKMHPSGEKYTVFGSHNVSMAIDTPNGLVVPNIKNVQNMNILEIQKELQRLQELSQSNKLSTSDLTGGTITVSNVGVIAGTYVKALLFDGQAMIMGVGRCQKLPRIDSDGDVVARDMVNVAFSADHRHCDGATVARLIAEMKKYLENPELMLMYLH